MWSKCLYFLVACVMLSGCIASTPVLHVRSIIPSGRYLLLDVEAAVRHSSFEGSGWEDCARNYLVGYRFAERGSSKPLPFRSVAIPWSCHASAAYSESRLFVYTARAYSEVGFRPSCSSLLLWGDPRLDGWRTVGKWTYALPQSSSFVVSTNARYLAILIPDVEVLDANSLRGGVSSNSVAAMLKRAKRLARGNLAEYTLTGNLHFVGVRCKLDDVDLPRRKLDELQAGWPRDATRSEAVFIISPVGEIAAAVPTQLGAEKLIGIDESRGGELQLLYYGGYLGKGYEYLLRNGSYSTIARTVCPPMSDGVGRMPPTPIWDADHSCVWFYIGDYNPYRSSESLQVRRWEYSSGTLGTFDFAVAAAFRRMGDRYAPR